MANRPVVRETQPEDIDTLSEYWYDNVVLRQQTEPSFRLAPDARAQWARSLVQRTKQTDTVALTCVQDDAIIGCIVCRMAANVPGFLPERVAFVDDFVLDLHSPHSQRGAGTLLVQTLADRLRVLGIEQVVVSVPERLPVQQAFWKGYGTRLVARQLAFDV